MGEPERYFRGNSTGPEAHLWKGSEEGGWGEGPSSRKDTGSGYAGLVDCTEEWDLVLWAIGSHGGFRARE